MERKHPRSLTLSVVEQLQSIPASDWNRLAGRSGYSAFLEHEFLSTLEESGSASEERGWYPRHLVIRDEGHLVAAAPLYGKTHSMGEFIFDQGLAQVSQSLELPYYPKLVATLPLTPSPGYRFLVDPEYDSAFIEALLLGGMRRLKDAGLFSSLGILFVDPAWEVNLLSADAKSGELAAGLARSLDDEGRSSSGSEAASDELPAGQRVARFQRWAHQYFLWENREYRDFDDFLHHFNKNQRRNIQKERQSIQEQGLIIRILTGDSLTDEIMDQMYGFYETTNDNFGPWAAFFLNKEWFRLIGRRWNHRVLIFTAWLPGEDDPVAMSFLVKKGDTLVGRYWGSRCFVKNLHFELCYYAPIEYAISEKLSFFDPGMGSPHKARRGFGSREFGSFHDFTHPEMASLFQSVMAEANQAEKDMIEELEARVPWKR